MEVKSLETDTAPKVGRILANHRLRLEFSDIESSSIDEVLDRLPDGGEIREEIYRARTQPVERAFEKANRQIRVTRETFKLSLGYGLVVFLNERVNILLPTSVLKRVAQSILKRDQSAKPRYEAVDAVWLLNEAHGVTIGTRRALVDLIRC